jgi:hypothetical protein
MAVLDDFERGSALAELERGLAEIAEELREAGRGLCADDIVRRVLGNWYTDAALEILAEQFVTREDAARYSAHQSDEAESAEADC